MRVCAEGEGVVKWYKVFQKDSKAHGDKKFA